MSKTADAIARDCVEEAAALVRLAVSLWDPEQDKEALDLLQGAEGDLDSVAAGTI